MTSLSWRLSVRSAYLPVLPSAILCGPRRILPRRPRHTSRRADACGRGRPGGLPAAGGSRPDRPGPGDGIAQPGGPARADSAAAALAWHTSRAVGELRGRLGNRNPTPRNSSAAVLNSSMPGRRRLSQWVSAGQRRRRARPRKTPSMNCGQREQMRHFLRAYLLFRRGWRPVSQVGVRHEPPC